MPTAPHAPAATSPSAPPHRVRPRFLAARPTRVLFAAAIGVGLFGCNAADYIPLRPPPPTDEQLSRGLIVLYPGASSEPAEMTLWYVGLSLLDLGQAIESVAWGVPFNSSNNYAAFDRTRDWAVVEAARLAAYIDAHPGCPVTLVGYSAGCGVAALVAGAMPSDHLLERVVLVSPGISPGFDLKPALDHTAHGIISYWSPLDTESPSLTTQIGTFDQVIGPPAASEGFTSDDPRLIQVPWNPIMALYLNFGGHLDFLFNPFWVHDFVGAWVQGRV